MTVDDDQHGGGLTVGAVGLTVDGAFVPISAPDGSLLDVLRDDAGVTSAKDGCSPQGQCGCCTVLVDDKPRVACVTPARRVVGRRVTTMDGLEVEARDRLIGSFVDHGASQCGFCTPGIVVRLAALGADPTPDQVRTALLAHLCRCTGWQSIVEAACDVAAGGVAGDAAAVAPRSLAAAGRRAEMEGGVAQEVGAEVVAGGGGFAADTAPPGCLVAVPDGAGGWAVAPTVHAARSRVGQVQGRRSGHAVSHPIAVPDGEWAVTLQTTWVEPGYLEPDASWCEPGGNPASPLANGGAFGAKLASPVAAAARALADEHGRPVLAVLSREDAVRMGPKRPPIGAGMRADGSGIIRVARTPGFARAVASVAPGLIVEEVDVAGPPTSAALRGAGWAEAAVLAAALQSLGADGADPGSGRASVTAPGGGRADAVVAVDEDGKPVSVAVTVAAGEVLDHTVLRSYVLGAAHMALGWVCTEALAVDDASVPQDLTIRSWGVLRARDLPPVTVHIQAGPPGDDARPASDAAFAAVAAACWIAQGRPPRWPTIRGSYR